MNKYCPFKAAFEKKKNKILQQGNEGRIASYYSKHRKYQNFAFTFLLFKYPPLFSFPEILPT
jgi:hypothetical protein